MDNGVINKNKKKLIAVLAVVIIIAAAGTIIYMNKGFGEPVPGASETTTEAKKLVYLYMPNLIGKSEEGAVNKLEEVGFYNFKVDYEAGPEGLSGTVIRQSIPENATVGTDFEIIIYVAE